jgi:large subunit ribosomal protein L5e
MAGSKRRGRKQKGGFVKVYKNKAYFMRYQTKFRRRREGKTDYYARRRLVAQDKNKYNSPKYRFVVRFTNRDVICQIAYSKIVGDVILASAYSHELPKYGIKLGLTNYAACYATGLLCARRVLSKLKLADKYEGKTKVDGEDYTVEPNEKGPQPFYALLDVGLVRTTTGNRLFAALKGACDGGVEIPHSETRFVGYNHEESKLDGEALRKHLFGGHVADYMRKLSEEKPKTYAKQFSGYIAAGISADDLEAVYSKAHAAIRKDPSFVPTKKKADQKKSFRSQAQTRLSLAERKKRVEARLAASKAQ